MPPLRPEPEGGRRAGETNRPGGRPPEAASAPRGISPAAPRFPADPSRKSATSMIRSTTITADYSLRPSALADTPATLVEARQPVIVWGPPGCAKSRLPSRSPRPRSAPASTQAAAPVGRRRRFCPRGDATGRWLVNLEEPPSAVPMVQAALYQLVLDRRCGVDPISWTPDPLGRRYPPCRNRDRRTRGPSGARWSARRLGSHRTDSGEAGS